MFCSDFGGWGKSTIKLLLKIHQYLCIPATSECLVCFPTKFKSPSSKEHLYFEKSGGNLCDMDYQKYCKIVASKEICLHYPAPLTLYFRRSVLYQASQKKITRLVDCGLQSMRPIFTTKMLIYQSKANLDENILFGKITRL